MQPLNILYQDEHLVAVHKPSGLLVHRSALARGETEFLLQRLRDQLGKRVYPVHRLDRPTSGVMVFGLSSEAAALLSEGFSERQVEKRYLAVVRGKAPEQERLDYPLREEDGTRPKAEMPAMPAMTDIRRLDSVELPVQVDRYPVARYSLVEARPLTGRRHQIRRHLSRRGYPIIGDAKHGKSVHNRFFAEQLAAPRLLLAATYLAFDHPLLDKRIQLSCAVGETMKNLFEQFGWQGHLPLDSVRTPPIATPSALQAL
ncbi:MULTISPECIES: pseudouridine synthase [Halomonadaceae]|jgi:tRNA pseudouridine65 synthase|uniref:tRNA pseudouridine synthase C n=1 Tax=Vreelandella aquamarina TaxID=77097 RepID=A0A6F8XGP4_9GAMM|nr:MULTISPECIES: pseudouridine synthase [Halomonas]MCP1303303.1 pseudouridine synthase [Halomonas sp. R1t8]MCP1329286.1 pseudouridine synthase [Halomonas sp. R1t4]PHR01506.1 MAG: pseudouridylate synthase [Halomonas sp.]BCB72733.1 tRNA pseudouridine(65) synthase TruC [Halomonas meridiana]HBK37110.1 pseudouridylate synthase [Halomonas sp.]